LNAGPQYGPSYNNQEREINGFRQLPYCVLI
jgi:hypothetical protein